MRVEEINGVKVPYELSVTEISEMLSIGDMSEFAAGCEALSYIADKRAFDVLNGYINDKDKYRRLCILKTIFRHPMSDQVTWFLEQSVLSDDILFVENALLTLCEHEIKIDDSILLSAALRHCPDLNYSALYVLKRIKATEDNYIKLIKLFKSSVSCGQKEVLAEILLEHFLTEKAEELSVLFSVDSFEKIRKLAVKTNKE